MNKKIFVNLSITLKILLSVVIVLFCSLSAGGWLLNRTISQQMTNIYMDLINTLSGSLEDGAKISLERGQMKNFKRLLADQAKVKGIVDVSLYDRRGMINLSSSGLETTGKVLAPAILERMMSQRQPEQVIEGSLLRIYTPQIITGDCVRCHPTWVVGEQGGVISLTYDLSELNQLISRQRLMLVVGIFTLLGIISIMIIFIAKSIARPVISMTEVMVKLAGGDLNVQGIDADRCDEIGQMAAAVKIFHTNAVEKKRLLQEQEELKKQNELVQQEMMNSTAHAFESSIGHIINAISTAVTELQGSAQVMSNTADKTTAQYSSVAAFSEQTSANVLMVASATEELTCSVGEISEQVTKSSQIAREAVQKAEEANVMVKGLTDASRKIGDVVQLITDIAKQTKLLALNATIEAARAGEVGKGFAVVANEVKELAKQTTLATKEIADHISGIQNATQGAVSAITSITQTINNINDISTTIASAVEEQSVVTKDIAQSTSQAASGTQEVSKNIAEVAEGAEATGLAANKVLDNADGLSKQAEMLQNEVNNFLTQVLSSSK